MKKIIKLTESELINLIVRNINEDTYDKNSEVISNVKKAGEDSQKVNQDFTTKYGVSKSTVQTYLHLVQKFGKNHPDVKKMERNIPPLKNWSLQPTNPLLKNIPSEFIKQIGDDMPGKYTKNDKNFLPKVKKISNNKYTINTPNFCSIEKDVTYDYTQHMGDWYGKRKTSNEWFKLDPIKHSKGIDKLEKDCIWS
jgi:hypothetical protein